MEVVGVTARLAARRAGRGEGDTDGRLRLVDEQGGHSKYSPSGCSPTEVGVAIVSVAIVSVAIVSVALV